MAKRKPEAVKQEAVRLWKNGIPKKDIAEQMQIPLRTVCHWIQYEKVRPYKRQDVDCTGMKPGEPGWNADRHGCVNCRYRVKEGNSGCDYYVVTGRFRGGKVCGENPADCKVWEEEPAETGEEEPAGKGKRRRSEDAERGGRDDHKAITGGTDGMHPFRRKP